MARVLTLKKLEKTRLLKEYASWIYCDNCNQTIGYLCYVTYDKVSLTYTCNCKSEGSLLLDFDELKSYQNSKHPLNLIKNRFCCPVDESALITILNDKLIEYTCEIICNSCATKYTVTKSKN